MKRGKKICTTLKEIRLQVARANGITYEPVECNHKGECLGTCPKCEEEVRYIERQLSIRRIMGKAAAVAGVAMGVGMAAQPIEAIAQNIVIAPKDSTVISALQTLKVESLLNEGEQGIVVRGRVVDDGEFDGEPLIGATICRKDVKKWAVSDQNGMFAIEVPEGCPLEVSYVGFVSFSFEASEQQPVVEAALKAEVMGIIKQYDDVYGHEY